MRESAYRIPLQTAFQRQHTAIRHGKDIVGATVGEQFFSSAIPESRVQRAGGSQTQQAVGIPAGSTGQQIVGAICRLCLCQKCLKLPLLGRQLTHTIGTKRCVRHPIRRKADQPI